MEAFLHNNGTILVLNGKEILVCETNRCLGIYANKFPEGNTAQEYYDIELKKAIYNECFVSYVNPEQFVVEQDEIQ